MRFAYPAEVYSLDKTPRQEAWDTFEACNHLQLTKSEMDIDSYSFIFEEWLFHAIVTSCITV